jgi:hypothetical protein
MWLNTFLNVLSSAEYAMEPEGQKHRPPHPTPALTEAGATFPSPLPHSQHRKVITHYCHFWVTAHDAEASVSSTPQASSAVNLFYLNGHSTHTSVAQAPLSHSIASPWVSSIWVGGHDPTWGTGNSCLFQLTRDSAQLVQKLPPPPCSRKPATGLHLEPDESITYPFSR